MGYPQETASTKVFNSKLPFDEQDKTIAALSEAVSVLYERLQPLLTPVESEDKEQGDRPGALQSEYASMLSDNNFRIRRVTNIVNNLIENLEV